jgi:UDP-N-acetylglucosamine/UDP-N-acetylgalactosamine 4-epimerase
LAGLNRVNNFENTYGGLRQNPRQWLVTGAAGFIGSNLVESLLKLDQIVVGLDDFSTGRRDNLNAVRESISPLMWNRFTLIEGDITDIANCRAAVDRTDYVLHEAAMASVPQSIQEPIACHEVNVAGFLNLLHSSSEARIKRLVYASSCAVYGDDPLLPKTEASKLRCLSPYALTKLMDEQYALLWPSCYGFESIGLRYFNIFGPRQDPNGAYAAVIPRWIEALLHDKDVIVYGDGSSSRDFCHVWNVVEANICAATTSNPAAVNQVFNIGAGVETSLNTLFDTLQNRVLTDCPTLKLRRPQYCDFRAGDIRHSQASIMKGEALLGYRPGIEFEEGLTETVRWYLAHPDRT